jgi:hypothetical protein
MEPMTFALAQYTPDLLRQEPRNIGLFVADHERIVMRFVGEDAMGIVKLGSLPPDLFNDVELFLDWHDHWAAKIDSVSTLDVPATFLKEQVVRNKGKAFAVIYGGEYEPDERQSLADVASLLFGRLVLTQTADGETDAASRDGHSRGYLARRIASEFRRIGILESATTPENLFVRHPIRAKFPVMGENPVPHTADFYQENGRRYVMEQVDFSVQTLARARDHAMLSQYILTDVVEAARKRTENSPPLHPIAIINRVATKANAMQDYALAALSSIPGVHLVYWDRDDERKRFLDERRSVAEIMGMRRT